MQTLNTGESLGQRDDKNIGSRVMKGAALMTAARLASRMFSFLNLVVLARLLDPHDYGIATLAISTIALLQAVSDVRVNAAIVNMNDVTHRHLDTAFTLTMARGLILGLALLLFADLFASFSRSPELAAPLRVLAIVPVLDGLRNPAFILYQRNIDFGPEFWRTTLSTVLASVAVIAGAFIFRSYWAIIVGTLAMRAGLSLLTYWRVPVRIGFSLQDWREFLSFGGWLTLAGILEYVRSGFAPTFLFGRYFGTVPLGQFSIAQTLSALVTKELAMPLITAIAPGLATVVDDPSRLRQAFRDAQSTVFGIVLPAGLGVAVLAPGLLLLVAGPKWAPAAPLVQILAPVYALSLLNAASAAVAQAKRKTRLFFIRNSVITALTLPVLVIASLYGDVRWGVVAVAWGVLVETYMTARLAAGLVGSQVRESVVLNWRPIVAGALMVAAVLAAGPARARDTLPLLVELLPRIALGALVYGLALYALWRVARRPTGFETKMMDMAGPRLPAFTRPAFHWLRYPK